MNLHFEANILFELQMPFSDHMEIGLRGPYVPNRITTWSFEARIIYLPQRATAQIPQKWRISIPNVQT